MMNDDEWVVSIAVGVGLAVIGFILLHAIGWW
jgi:hypothetical protein